MTDESHSFTAARTRLEEIVTQVRKKDTSLEKSLDLLEEGVRLANVCTELIDRADWVSASAASETTQDTPEVSGAPLADQTDAVGDVVQDAVAADTAPFDAERAAEESGSDESAPTPNEVWSDDEAWADETQDDPSDGDDGHGA